MFVKAWAALSLCLAALRFPTAAPTHNNKLKPQCGNDKKWALKMWTNKHGREKRISSATTGRV